MPRHMVSAEQVAAGHAIYTPRTLRAYDFVVLGVSNRFIWKCRSGRLLEHYDRHVTANHLDVGVGTGWFLDRCRFPSAAPRVALMDLNADVLAFASHRIARFAPEAHLRNVLEPISIDAPKFDSVAINYLLHCVPGSMVSKAVVFDHLQALMNPKAVLFGSTLLHGGVARSGLAKRLMALYNRKGIFSNRLDDLDGLKRELGRRASRLRRSKEETMRDLLTDAAERSIAYLQGLDTRAVAPDPSAVASLAAFDEPLPDVGSDDREVLALLDRFGSPATMAMAGPRFFGFVIGAALPVTLAASWLAGAWDQCAGPYNTAPAVARLEQAPLRWLVASTRGATIVGREVRERQGQAP